MDLRVTGGIKILDLFSPTLERNDGASAFDLDRIRAVAYPRQSREALDRQQVVGQFG